MESQSQVILQAVRSLATKPEAVAKTNPVTCDGLQATNQTTGQVSADLAGSLIGSVSSIPAVRTFLCEKKKKEEASPQGKNRAMWGEEAKPLKHKNDAERKSDL